MSDKPHSLPDDGAITDLSDRTQVIEYIRDMTNQLSELAERAQCPPLSDALRQVSQTVDAL